MPSVDSNGIAAGAACLFTAACLWSVGRKTEAMGAAVLGIAWMAGILLAALIRS